MSQGDKFKILVDPNKAHILLKAAHDIAVKGSVGTEGDGDFERQNPASKRLVDEVESVFNQAVTNMVKEVKELLGGDGK